MVDYQIRLDQGIDLLRVALEPEHRVAHRGKVHHGRDTCEILEHNPARHERDFQTEIRFGFPPGKRPDVIFGDGAFAGMAEHILKQYAYRERKPVDVDALGSGQGIEAVDRG